MMTAWVPISAAFPADGDDVVNDFRTSRFDYKHFRFEGPNADDFIKPEADGLRWRFGSGSAPSRPVGVYWNSRIKGDFGVAVEFELLKAEKPQSGDGVGAELYMTFEGPTKDAVSVAYVSSSDGSLNLRFLHLSTDADGDRKAMESRTARLPADAHRRQMSLQLKRHGTKLIASFASKGAEHDVAGMIEECDVPNTDVLMSRFAGLAGKDKGADLDMRLLEFVVGAADSPRMQIASQPIVGVPNLAMPPEPVGTVTASRSIGGIILAAMAGCLGMAALGWWLLKLRVRSIRTSLLIPTALTPGRHSPEAGVPKMNFQCSSCGAKLKAEAGQRGLRIRCPRCHDHVLVIE